MTQRPTLLRYLLPLLAASMPAFAEDIGTLYRCRGSDGVTSFQQQPCSDSQTDAGRIRYDPVAPPVRASAATPPTVAPALAAPSGEANAAAEKEAAATPAAVAFGPLGPAQEPPSDAVECLRPDSSTYVRSGECDRSEIGGDTIEGYVIDETSGQRVWTQTVAPKRQILDPARALGRSEACELARLHIDQIKAGRSPGGRYLSDAERVRDRHCG